MYFRSTYRRPFRFGAVLSSSLAVCEDRKGGELVLEDIEEADESAVEQQAYEMVESAFGEDAAAELTPTASCKTRKDQLADDNLMPSLYLEDSNCNPYSIDTVVQYREPGVTQSKDRWEQCIMKKNEIFKVTSREEDWIVARMYPINGRKEDRIYLLMPSEYCDRSLRRTAQLPE